MLITTLSNETTLVPPVVGAFLVIVLGTATVGNSKPFCIEGPEGSGATGYTLAARWELVFFFKGKKKWKKTKLCFSI